MAQTLMYWTKLDPLYFVRKLEKHAMNLNDRQSGIWKRLKKKNCSTFISLRLYILKLVCELLRSVIVLKDGLHNEWDICR